MKTTTLNDKYEKRFDGWISHEMGVKEGEMRVIDDQLHFCKSIDKNRVLPGATCYWCIFFSPTGVELTNQVTALTAKLEAQETLTKSLVKTLQDAGITYRNDELYSFTRWGFGVDPAKSIKNNDVKTDVSKVDNRLYFLAEALGLEWQESTSKSGYVKKVKKHKKK